MLPDTDSRPLLLATTSAGKLREIKAALEGMPYQLLTLSDIDAPEVPEETGLTFEDNAREKALYYGRFFNGPVLADDSGLEVQGLEAGPGILSARFGGENTGYDEKLRMLLNLLEDACEDARRARFRCVLALARANKLLCTFDGSIEGLIAKTRAGEEGFGYDPIFYVPELGKTLAQVSMEEKNRRSHRGRAAAKLRRYLEKSPL